MEIRKIFIVIFQLSLYIGKVFYYDVHNVVHWKWREGEKCFLKFRSAKRMKTILTIIKELSRFTTRKFAYSGEDIITAL